MCGPWSVDSPSFPRVLDWSRGCIQGVQGVVNLETGFKVRVRVRVLYCLVALVFFSPFTFWPIKSRLSLRGWSSGRQLMRRKFHTTDNPSPTHLTPWSRRYGVVQYGGGGGFLPPLGITPFQGVLSIIRRICFDNILMIFSAVFTSPFRFRYIRGLNRRSILSIPGGPKNPQARKHPRHSQTVVLAFRFPVSQSLRRSNGRQS